MSGSINKAILVGNLTRDPEVRRMSSGDPVINMTVATSERWRSKDTGERKEKSEFHRVVVFNERLAKVCEDYLRKGSKVYLEGSLQNRKFTDGNGVEKHTTEIVLQKFRGELQMLDGKSEGQSTGGGGYQDMGENGPKEDFSNADLEDSIPFITAASIW